jgi:D-threonate/D-erythronate kinase
MIAVIADDFTGAAEIGGIGLRRGLQVVIETNVEEAGKCDLLIIAADTRSMSASEASAEIQKITRQLITLKPRFIFKKLDSVLRGNIEHELVAQMDVMGLERAIVVAGNPYFERLITQGFYTIKGKPLAETSFAHDPEYPIHSSLATEIIAKGTVPVINKKPGDEIPEKGIVVGDVCCASDLQQWAGRINEKSLAAGGAGFFDIVLERFYPVHTCPSKGNFLVGEKSLFIFGSKFPKSENALVQMNGSNVEVMNMPESIYRCAKCEPEVINNWAMLISKRLCEGIRVAVTVNHEPNDIEDASSRIKEKIGMLVSDIMKNSEIDDLLIEGGATASVILKYMNISKLYPFKELDQGVIQMKVEGYPGLCITTKPGSYTWPSDMWISEITKN